MTTLNLRPPHRITPTLRRHVALPVRTAFPLCATCTPATSLVLINPLRTRRRNFPVSCPCCQRTADIITVIPVDTSCPSLNPSQPTCLFPTQFHHRRTLPTTHLSTPRTTSSRILLASPPITTNSRTYNPRAIRTSTSPSPTPEDTTFCHLHSCPLSLRHSDVDLYSPIDVRPNLSHSPPPRAQ